MYTYNKGNFKEREEAVAVEGFCSEFVALVVLAISAVLDVGSDIAICKIRGGGWLKSGYFQLLNWSKYRIQSTTVWGSSPQFVIR